jgi:hypothetical protein
MLLHAYSYLFHLVLTLFLAGIASVGWLSGSTTFDLEVIPWWSGSALIRWLMIGSLLGLASLVLAVSGKLRPAFAVWTLLVVCVLIYSHFLSAAYRYDGMDHFKNAMWMTGGALLAMLGGISQARSGGKRRTR